MEFRILGPLEVLEDGRAIPVRRSKERTVLAVLLLHANTFVSRDRLIDELWGSAPPPTARKAVNVYVSKLRQTLPRNGHDLIATADGGYRLVVEPGVLDTERFHGLTAQARSSIDSGDVETGARLLREALDLWRGPALAGIELESLGRNEVAELDDLRLAAVIDRIDCDIALGRHETVLGELNLLVREHPLRERLRAQQMLALYRGDRQADALEAYAEARRTLVDELGIEPSDALRRLQQAILRHDPALGRPEPTAPPAAVAKHETSPSAPRYRRRAAVVAALLIAAALLLAVQRSTSAAPEVTANSLVRLDPRTGKPTAVARVGVDPWPLAITPAAIWTVNLGDNTVSRFDRRTHAVESRAGFPGQPFDVAVDGDGNAWITSSYGYEPQARNGFLTRFAAGEGGTSQGTLYPSHIRTIGLPLPLAGYEALGGGFLWVIVGGHGPVPGDNRVALVDLATSRVASVKHLDESATAIAFGYGTAWIGTYDPDSRIEAIRAGAAKPTAVVLQKHSGWGPSAIAVGAGSVWALTAQPWASGEIGPELVQINPQTMHIVHRLDMFAEQPSSIAVGAGAVWTVDDGTPSHPGMSIAEIDPHTDTIVRLIELGDRKRALCGIRATARDVWVTVGSASCDTVGK